MAKKKRDDTMTITSNNTSITNSMWNLDFTSTIATGDPPNYATSITPTPNTNNIDYTPLDFTIDTWPITNSTITYPLDLILDPSTVGTLHLDQESGDLYIIIKVDNEDGNPIEKKITIKNFNDLKKLATKHLLKAKA